MDDARDSGRVLLRRHQIAQLLHPQSRWHEADAIVVAGITDDLTAYHFQAEERQLSTALTPLMFARYEKGKNYGSHVDDAMIGGMRTDVSFTLFLSDPKSYSGGELVIESTAGEEGIKLSAGSLVAYSTTTLHRVAKVTRGERLVCVGWVRSFIRDAAHRELLFDLDTARRRLFAREGNSPDYDLISKSTANLMRMWAED